MWEKVHSISLAWKFRVSVSFTAIIQGCSVLNETAASTVRFLPSPSWEPSEEESTKTEKRADDKEPPGPVPEGPAMKNKWKVHEEAAPAVWEGLPRKHRQPDSVWMNQSDQTVSRKKAGRSRGRMTLDERILPRVDSAGVRCNAEAAALFHWFGRLHFNAGNPFGGNLCLRDIFNMQSQLRSRTVKPKGYCSHLLQVVTPHYSSHLENHVVIH